MRARRAGTSRDRKTLRAHPSLQPARASRGRLCLNPWPLLQVSVNEAAAQICRFVPALLTRRDELFPLARQVVRDSGYLYSKGHAK